MMLWENNTDTVPETVPGAELLLYNYLLDYHPNGLITSPQGQTSSSAPCVIYPGMALPSGPSQKTGASFLFLPLLHPMFNQSPSPAGCSVLS